MVSCLRRNVINHALTAHALPFSNTENNVLINVNELPCASRMGMIHHVPLFLMPDWGDVESFFAS